MLTVIYAKAFSKDVKKLPQHILEQLASNISLLRFHEKHPLLHQKKLKGELADFYSFRITSKYRCIYVYRNSETIELLSVKHRKEVYRTIKHA